MSVPSNLIPTRVTELPTYEGTDVYGYSTYSINGHLYKAQLLQLVSLAFVPSVRSINTGAGLKGGGDLSQDRTIYADFSDADPVALGPVSPGFATQMSRADHVHPALDLASLPETQGVLPLGRGGTGAALSPSPGAVAYSGASALALSPPGALGSFLTSGGAGAPQWVPFSAANPAALGVAAAGTNIAPARADHVHPAADLASSAVSGLLPVTKGGTGVGTLTGYTKGNGTNPFTASPTVPAGDISGVLGPLQGGTGLNLYATGDLITATAPNVLSALPDVATGNALISGGVGTAPSWGKITLTGHVSGVLPPANGGVGAVLTHVAGAVIYSNGTALAVGTAGTAGSFLTSGGAGAPTWTAFSAANPAALGTPSPGTSNAPARSDHVHPPVSIGGGISGTMADFDNSLTDGNFVFQLNNADLGPIVRTGAGTSSADCMIELGGLRTGAGYSYIDFHGSPSADYDTRVIRNTGVDGNFSISNNGTGNLLIAQVGAGDIVFTTTAPNERMRIKADGNVGIGTNAPAAKLAVAGATWPRMAITKDAIATWFMGPAEPSNNWGLVLNGNPAVITATTGSNVGINEANPTSPLTVSHAFGAAGTTSAGIRVVQNNGPGGMYLAAAAGGASEAHNADYIAGTGWIARATEASLFQQAAGNHSWWGNNGLTVGLGFNPTKNMELAYNGNLSVRGTITATGSYVIANGARNVWMDAGEGQIKFQGDAGGWVTGSAFIGATGPYKGGFGALGGGDTLNYFFMGPAYDSALSLKVYPATGAVTMGGALDIAGQVNISGGLNVQGVMGVPNGPTAGELLALYTSAARGAGNGYMSFSDTGGRKGYFGFGGANDTWHWTNECAGGVIALQAASTIDINPAGGLRARFAGDGSHFYNGNVFVSGGNTGFGGFRGIESNELFTHLGMQVPHYGIQYGTPSDSSSNVVACISGYAGVRMFSAGLERMRVAAQTEITAALPDTLVLTGGAATGAGQNYIKFQSNDKTRMGFMGFGGADETFTIYNDRPGAINIVSQGDTNFQNGGAQRGAIKGGGNFYWGSTGYANAPKGHFNIIDPVAPATGAAVRTLVLSETSNTVGYHMAMGMFYRAPWVGTIDVVNGGAAGELNLNPSGGPVTCSGTLSAVDLIATSDERLKENIADAGDPGAIIDAIRVRSFDWRADGKHVSYGVVAQELQLVAPEYVVEREEEMLGVSYPAQVAMLIKEIQLLRARVAALEAV